MFILKKKYKELEEKLSMADAIIRGHESIERKMKQNKSDLEYKLGIASNKLERAENKEAYYFTRLAEFESKEDAYFKANKKLIEENERLKIENNNLKVDNNRLKTRTSTLEGINVKVNRANVDMLMRLWCNRESKRQLELLENRVRNGEYNRNEIANYINEIRFRVGV